MSLNIKAHREQLTLSLSHDKESEVEAPITTYKDTGETAKSSSTSGEWSKKHKSVSENQEDFYNKIIKQTRQNSRSKSFKVHDKGGFIIYAEGAMMFLRGAMTFQQ